MDLPDHDLFSRWTAGDLSAGDALLRRHWPRLIAEARRAVGPELLLREDYQDVLDSVMGGIEPEFRLIEWQNAQAFVRFVVQRIAWKAADHRDYWDAQERRVHPPAGSTDNLAAIHDIPDPGTTPSRTLAEREARERVNRAMQRPPPREFKALKSRLWDGQTLDEIAEHFGLSRSGANRPVAQAVTRLEDHLGVEG